MCLPLLAVQVLGMTPGDFSILYQDTEAGPYDFGSSGSQTTFNNGRAVVEAANEVADKLRELAAEKLEIDPLDLELRDGAVSAKGSPQKAVRSLSWLRPEPLCSAKARDAFPSSPSATPTVAAWVGSAWSRSSSRS